MQVLNFYKFHLTVIAAIFFGAACLLYTALSDA